MKNISVIGAGYVGLVTAACFAELGNKVNIIEIAPEKVSALKSGRLPISEPDLPELWKRNQVEGRICVTNNYIEGLLGADFAFITVGTPSGHRGKPDLKFVRSAVKSVAEATSGPLIVVLKSTVPVGTADMVAELLRTYCQNGHKYSVISNPEFLREGMAVYDFMNPNRIVVGGREQNAIDSVVKLYEEIQSEMITCDARTAEMSKYAANVFLATKISFINEIALLCDEAGADVKKVARVVGKEIGCGPGYLNAGLGWGGSCLPKDVQGLIHMGKVYRVPLPLVHAVQRINQRQPLLIIEKLHRFLGPLENKIIGILGLSFKPGSDDMREARSTEVIKLLIGNSCKVKAYDPVAMEEAARIMPGVTYCEDAYKVASGSDALILVTEWDEFKELNFRKIASLMNRPVMIDSRNLYNPEEMIKAGFLYDNIGRRVVGQEISKEVLLT